jgi:hypothetical protein
MPNDNALISIQEFVDDWATRNEYKGKCLASLMPTVGARIAVSAVDTTEYLEFQNGPEPISRTERERIAAFLRKAFGKPTPKFLAHYEGLDLRTEQIGPDLWGWSCYDREARPFPRWIDLSTSIGGKESAQRDAG